MCKNQLNQVLRVIVKIQAIKVELSTIKIHS